MAIVADPLVDGGMSGLHLAVGAEVYSGGDEASGGRRIAAGFDLDAALDFKFAGDVAGVENDVQTGLAFEAGVEFVE